MEINPIHEPMYIDTLCSKDQHTLLKVFVFDGEASIVGVWGNLSLCELEEIQKSLTSFLADGVGVYDSFTALIEVTGYVQEHTDIGSFGYWDWNELWEVPTNQEIGLKEMQRYLIQFDENIDMENWIPF